MTTTEFYKLDLDTKNQLFDCFKTCTNGPLFLSDFLKDYKIGEDGVVTSTINSLKEEHVSGKDRYSEGSVETIVYIESMMKAWEKNGVPADVAYNLGQVLRYLSSRLGAKDGVKVELGKAHNYLYRAINGKWYEE